MVDKGLIPSGGPGPGNGQHQEEENRQGRQIKITLGGEDLPRVDESGVGPLAAVKAGMDHPDEKSQQERGAGLMEHGIEQRFQHQGEAAEITAGQQERGCRCRCFQLGVKITADQEKTQRRQGKPDQPQFRQ